MVAEDEINKPLQKAYIFWPSDDAPEPLLSIAEMSVQRGVKVSGVIIGHDREWLRFLGGSLSASDYVIVTTEWQGDKYEMCILGNQERGEEAE